MPYSRTRADRDHERNLLLIKTLGRLGTTVVWCAGFVVLLYFLNKSLIALSGEETDASVILALLGDVKVAIGLSIIGGGGGVLYGLIQRAFRLSERANFEQTIRILERYADPARSSSVKPIEHKGESR